VSSLFEFLRYVDERQKKINGGDKTEEITMKKKNAITVLHEGTPPVNCSEAGGEAGESARFEPEKEELT
jgi:hypothetical protein